MKYEKSNILVFNYVLPYIYDSLPKDKIVEQYKSAFLYVDFFLIFIYPLIMFTNRLELFYKNDCEVCTYGKNRWNRTSRF